MKNSFEVKQIDINQPVLDKISQRNIKIRPHWKFLAEKIGFESGLLLILIFGVFVFGLIMYYWRVNELHRLVGLGRTGIWHIFLNFPFELVALVAVLLSLINFFIKKMDWGYKHTWLVWVSTSFALILLFSSAALALDLNERFEKTVQASNVPVLKPFYNSRIRNIYNASVMGKIELIKDNEIGIKESLDTKTSSTKQVIFKKGQLKIESNNIKLKVGDDVKLVGEVEHGKFKPWGLLVTKEKNAINNKQQELDQKQTSLKNNNNSLDNKHKNVEKK